MISADKNTRQLLQDTALLLSATDFRDERAAEKALQQTERALTYQEAGKQAAHRILNMLRIYHLSVSSGDKQFFGYALQKAFKEWIPVTTSYILNSKP